MSNLEIGYWSIRGLGAPLRMMCMYAGVSFHANNYDCKEMSGIDGNKPSWDTSEWFAVKPSLKEINPLINLPYVRDGDVIISQSNACMLYLGKKFNMLGHKTQEISDCEQLLCEIMDLRNKMTGFAYGIANQITALNVLNNADGILGKLDTWLSREVNQRKYSGAFLVGNMIPAPDFHLYEMLDQYDTLAHYFKLPSPLEKYTFLASFKMKFQEQPENARYFACKLSKFPFNNKYAGFGATPSCDGWTKGMKYDWAQTSGLY